LFISAASERFQSPSLLKTGCDSNLISLFKCLEKIKMKNNSNRSIDTVLTQIKKRKDRRFLVFH